MRSTGLKRCQGPLRSKVWTEELSRCKGKGSAWEISLGSRELISRPETLDFVPGKGTVTECGHESNMIRGVCKEA